MLVITRSLNEAVMIGESIEIRVVRIKAGEVRLSIAAPRETTIHRGEIDEAIRAQRQIAEANSSEPSPLDCRPPSLPSAPE